MSEVPLPQPDAFHAQAAVGWLELGSAVEARRELAAISPAHGEHPDVLEVWWPIFAEEKNWNAALASAEKLVAQAPERQSGWIEQSYALHELKRTREAYERLAPVVKKFSDAYVIPYNLACYQCQLGNKAEALDCLRRAVKASDAQTIRTMAMNDPDLSPLRDAIAKMA